MFGAVVGGLFILLLLGGGARWAIGLLERAVRDFLNGKSIRKS